MEKIINPLLVNMSAVAENFSLGMPAEIGKIEKELKKLWADGEGALTRASLINLAVYSEKKGSLAENTRLMSQVTESHACRAIVIEADTHAADNQAQAWISAHCHVSRAGSRQVCSEQILFQLGGPCAKLLTSIVFSHLDSDLRFSFGGRPSCVRRSTRNFGHGSITSFTTATTGRISAPK